MLKYACFLIAHIVLSKADPSLIFDYPNVQDDVYEQPVNLMGPAKSAHVKDQPQDVHDKDGNVHPADESWPSYDFSKFDSYLTQHTSNEHNRIKRRAKRRRVNKRRNRQRVTTAPEVEPQHQNQSVTDAGARRINKWASEQNGDKKKKGFLRSSKTTEIFDPPIKEMEGEYVEMPKDLYQAHLRAGVIFRIHMSEAILKMQYRNYGEDKDESVIEADVEYLRLTRKVINDELTKFEDLKWLVGWFNNRSDLIHEHMCNVRYFAVGTPPTMFTHSEEYMKRMCLFDNVYIDHIPYVVGEDGSLMAAVAPPVLHCDAATCTSVPFIDSVMFDERLGRSNVRTVTRCQASCRAHCRNDADCLKRCSDRCLRSD